MNISLLISMALALSIALTRADQSSLLPHTGSQSRLHKFKTNCRKDDGIIASNCSLLQLLNCNYESGLNHWIGSPVDLFSNFYNSCSSQHNIHSSDLSFNQTEKVLSSTGDILPIKTNPSFNNQRVFMEEGYITNYLSVLISEAILNLCSSNYSRFVWCVAPFLYVICTKLWHHRFYLRYLLRTLSRKLDIIQIKRGKKKEESRSKLSIRTRSFGRLTISKFSIISDYGMCFAAKNICEKVSTPNFVSYTYKHH